MYNGFTYDERNALTTARYLARKLAYELSPADWRATIIRLLREANAEWRRFNVLIQDELDKYADPCTCMARENELICRVCQQQAQNNPEPY